MQGVIVERIHEPERAASSLQAELESTAEEIRQRAFDYYLSRGGRGGADLDDWLRAEREVVWSPRAEMTEDDGEIVLRVDTAGLDAGNIRVKATRDAILIRADAGHRHEESKGRICFCDFGEKLFRQFDLPNAIDVDRVSATLDNGILQIVARKPAGEWRRVTVMANSSS